MKITQLILAWCALIPCASFSTVEIEKPVFIFDLGGVLLETSHFGMATELGWPLISYLTTEWQAPTHLKTKFFDLMTKAAGKQAPVFYPTYPEPLYATYDGLKLPHLFCEFMRGLISSQEIIALLHEKSNQLYQAGWFTALYEKELVDRLTIIMFDPEIRARHTYALTECVQLAQFCKEQGYEVYILSNWDAECMSHARRKFAYFFEHYVDGIVISADPSIRSIKPEPDIYLALLERYRLKAENCYFFDDTPSNIIAAQQLGFNGVLCERIKGKLGTYTNFTRARQVIEQAHKKVSSAGN